ncbi:hypothetical protein SMD11_1277 [Streptomyces albireticuli]|uniref:Uncharacterized protein n=1 Tax=Streptomyces albireticuli TaxID=1940 RepID=A0A1Z2KY16_9ACTN|nr:hypothetical protein [Streptomyces albireticuli]ARZ66938.1 hypothetical protein SMD11_1277 [Streptomyces albireticuli]
MQTYEVEVYQTATYRFEIKAESAEAAWEAAGDFWGEVPTAEEVKYLHSVYDSLVDSVTVKGGE